MYNLFEKVYETSSLSRITSLLETLDCFEKASDKVELVSDKFVVNRHEEDFKRMTNIINYVQSHFQGNLELSDISELSGMTKNSFCRYFKFKTGKTFTEFVNEMRVTNACKLLSEKNSSLKESCFESGFNNLVSFHKIFKNITGLTPKQFKSKF